MPAFLNLWTTTHSVRRDPRRQSRFRPEAAWLEDRRLLTLPLGYTLNTLATFDGVNGLYPYGVVLDDQGNLYGTTDGNTVFEVVQGSNAITTLATVDNLIPNPNSLVVDGQGNVFGLTDSGAYGGGSVFEIVKGSSTATTVASFNGTTTGAFCYGLSIDSHGNLYGVTIEGGAQDAGMVFEIAKGSNSITPLAPFPGYDAFTEPLGAPVADSHGNLFGTIHSGGIDAVGSVYEVAHGSATVIEIAEFIGTNGAFPDSNLLIDGHGNLYGTAVWGGAGNFGTVFEIPTDPTNPLYDNISDLHVFVGTDGWQPIGGLVMDGQGDLIGTTMMGGPDYNPTTTNDSAGTVYEFDPSTNAFTLIQAFQWGNGTPPQGGAAPICTLAIDGHGNLFGTTTQGGSFNDGTVFELTSNLTTTSVSLTAGTPAAVTGQLVTFTATVSPPSATGTVTFFDGSNPIGTGTLNGSGTATFSTVDLLAGTHSITAQYGSDDLDKPSSSTPSVVRIHDDATRTTVSASVQVVPDGGSVVYSALVTPVAPGAGDPGGTVQFEVDGSPIGVPVNVIDNVATSPAISGLAYRTHAVTADYIPGPGDMYASSDDYLSSTGTLPGGTTFQSNTTTALSVSDPSLLYAEPVTLTATVTAEPTAATPTGAVRFYLDGMAFGLAVLSGGVAALEKTIPVGSHSITASYVGNIFSAPSTSAGSSVSVACADTSTSGVLITAGGVPSSEVVYGTAITLSATVANSSTSAVPVGEVRFYDGSVSPPHFIGSAGLSGGTATLTTSALAGSTTHAIYAVSVGAANFASSQSPVDSDIQVNPAQVFASLSSSTGATEYGTPVTFIAAVSNTQSSHVPPGPVYFYLGYGTTSQRFLGAAPLVGGVATFTSHPNALPAGNDGVIAVYNGSANFQAAVSNAVAHTVSPANASATLSCNASGTVGFGTPVTFTAAVSDTDTGLVPNGLVQFWDGLTLLATVGLNAQGHATLTRSLARGPHSITAVYVVNANFNASTSGAVALTVV
jgi:uncharacterized repeat protein (TIGR03803 family)